MGEVNPGITNNDAEMKNTLFHDEVEGYTQQSNAKYIVLGTMVVAGAVFLGWVASILVSFVNFAM